MRAIGQFDMNDEKGEDERVICVPCRDPNWDTITDLDEMPMQLRREIEHFFSIFKQLEDKPVDVCGWQPAKTALESIEQAPDRYRSAG